MRIYTRCCVALVGLAALPAVACEYPPMVTVPEDGATATLDEMLAAQEEVKGYIAAMEAYVACVNEELEAGGGEDAPVQFRSLMAQRNNAAVTEMETVAAAFNEQLRAYREANATEEEE